MTRSFVLTNHKGGVGKSTTATNLALGRTSMVQSAGAPNPRVLLIDTDSQGHATLVTTGRTDYGVDNSPYTVLASDRATAAQNSRELYRALWLNAQNTWNKRRRGITSEGCPNHEHLNCRLKLEIIEDSVIYIQKSVMPIFR